MTFMGKTSIAFLALVLMLFAAVAAGCTSSSPAVKAGDNVTIDYIINSTTGVVYQTSYAEVAKAVGIYDPNATYSTYTFQVGSNTTIKGIDEAVAGMKVGDTKTVTVPPEKSYGPRNESWVLPYNLSDITAANITLHVNDTIGVPPYGIRARVSAIDVENNTVYLDFNRAHAGETLVITITVRKIE